MLQYSYQLTYLYPLLVVRCVRCHPLAVLGKCQEKYLFHPLCESKHYFKKQTVNRVLQGSEIACCLKMSFLLHTSM